MATRQLDGDVSGEVDPRDPMVESQKGPVPAQPFSPAERLRLDEALTMAGRETGLRFSLYLGELTGDTRAAAEDLHARSDPDPSAAVLLAVAPDQRVVEVVTGTAAARRLPDRACANAVLTMTAAFGRGDLVGGVVAGLRQLCDQQISLPGH